MPEGAENADTFPESNPDREIETPSGRKAAADSGPAMADDDRDYLKVANDRRVETEQFLGIQFLGQRGAVIALTASWIKSLAAHDREP